MESNDEHLKEAHNHSLFYQSYKVLNNQSINFLNKTTNKDDLLSICFACLSSIDALTVFFRTAGRSYTSW